MTVVDWPAVHEWAGLPEACRYQVWGPNTPEQTQAFVQVAANAWRQDPPVRFVYAVVFDQRVIGVAEPKLRGDHHGEITYGIHPDFWGRGAATQAAGQLLELGFQQHHLHRIVATCDRRNTASG